MLAKVIAAGVVFRESILRNSCLEDGTDELHVSLV